MHHVFRFKIFNLFRIQKLSMKKLSFFTFLLALSFGFIQAQLLCSTTLSNTVGTNGLVDFTAVGTGSAPISTYSFDYGDGNYGWSQSGVISHTYAAAGTYGVCVTAIFMDSCSAMSCDTVVTSGSGILCSTTLNSTVGTNGLVDFAAVGTGSAPLAIYSFDYGDGSFAYSQSGIISHTYPNAGTYIVCVTATFTDSCRATVCDTIVTSGSGIGNCQAAFFWAPDSSGQYSIIVWDQSSGTGLSYLWDFGDGGTSTLANPSHVYNGPGVYNLCVTVTSANPACTSTYCDSLVVVNKVAAPFSINVISSNATAVEPKVATALNVSLFPNPARDFFEVKLGMVTDADVSILLMDLSGKTVASQQAGPLSSGTHSLRVNTQDLPAGLYLARVQAGDAMSTHKVMITH
jgi:PKD repeat protein